MKCDRCGKRCEHPVIPNRRHDYSTFLAKQNSSISATAATANSIGSSRKPFEPKRSVPKGKKKRGVSGRSPEQWELIHHNPFGRVSQVEVLEEWLQSVLLPWEKESLKRYRKERYEGLMEKFRLYEATKAAFAGTTEQLRRATRRAFAPFD